MRVRKLIFILVNFLIFISFRAYAEFEEESCVIKKEKYCVNFGPKIVDGLKVSKCWSYEEILSCISKEKNDCKTFENNRGCNVIKAECLEEDRLRGLCKNFMKKFKCGTKYSENEKIKLVEAEFKVVKDEKDLANCSKYLNNQRCSLTKESCTEGPETRVINGKKIFKNCWRWARKYNCLTNSFIDECKDLRTKCKEINRNCIHKENKQCLHFESTYNCGNEFKRKQDCLEMNYCLGGACSSKERFKHNDFGTAIAKFSSIMSLRHQDGEGCECENGDCSNNPNIKANSCKFFRGKSGFCRKYTGLYNCCKNSGIIKDIFDCKKYEHDLAKQKESGNCVHIGTFKPVELLGFIKKTSYCCFKSKITRIIQQQAKAQLGINWGTPEYPDCRALTLEEIEKIDFEKIDFSEIAEDITHQGQKNFDLNSKSIRERMSDLADTASATGDLVKSKMKNYYTDFSSNLKSETNFRDENLR